MHFKEVRAVISLKRTLKIKVIKILRTVDFEYFQLDSFKKITLNVF